MPARLPPLTIDKLRAEARQFAEVEAAFPEPSLFGVTDGKAIGTYFEAKFKAYLHKKYTYTEGSAAKGIDFLELAVDMKVTSIRQPQSSCPYQSARQKIFGLGYGVLVFVYEKTDDPATKTATLDIKHVIFVEKNRTADFQTTRRIREILENEGNLDDLVGFMSDINLPVDDVEARNIGEEILKNPPEQGYLTISNALQWRLQYSRVITRAGTVDGILRIR